MFSVRRLCSSLTWGLLLLGTAQAQSSTSYRAIPTLDPSTNETPPLLPNVDDPQAVDAQTVCPGYRASNVKTTARGMTATLTLAGAGCNVYGTDIQSLNFVAQYQSNSRLLVSITPTYLDSSNSTQYVIQPYYVAQPKVENGASSANNDLQFSYSNSPSFSFTIIRKSTGDVVYSTAGSVLVFENQFVEFKTSMPADYNVYGLGERIHGLRLGNNFTATIYASDVGDPIDYNLYGSHPFYLDTRYYEVVGKKLNLVTNQAAVDANTKTYTSYSHGVYCRNAHPQEVILKPDSITWRMLGGNIELYFFSGPSQPEVTSQYSSVIGLPAMQQYWTFGYHQCRWGYENWTVLQDVVDSFAHFSLPLETVWTDIDYMNQYRDFDNDQRTFSYADGRPFLERLHSNNQHYIPIVDAAIYHSNPTNASDTYGTFDRGVAAKAFLTNEDGSLYIGDVWPGFTVFADWRAQGTQGWWTNEMLMWYKNVNWDGIWIDMSECSSFCVGSCGTGRVDENPVHPFFQLPGETNNVIYNYPEDFQYTNKSAYSSAQSASSAQDARRQSSATQSATTTVESATTTTPYLRTTPTLGVRNITYPPYVIKNSNGALGGHAVGSEAIHADGTENYDIHNLYGAEIINATYNALLQVFPGKRPFIIGRSNFAGSGSLAGHWGGDNAALWSFMYQSIPSALAHSLFAIPMFGVDTCGFNGNTDEELCNRWMQLSAFFPFYRNHNVLSAIPQEPYRWKSVIGAYKTAVTIRYALLPYMYTLFYQSHTTGSTVMRALSWEFPNDPTFADADRQFLLGPSIMVIPVLDPQSSSVNGVFPGIREGTKWYDWYTQTAVQAMAGANVTIAAPLGHIPVYIRGGSVLACQEPALTTTATRANDWSVIVALSSKNTASGSLYLDDGESLRPSAIRNVALTATNNGTLYASVTGNYKQSQPLDSVTVLGLTPAPTRVTLNGVSMAFTYNKATKVLVVTGLKSMTVNGAWMANWVLKWT